MFPFSENKLPPFITQPPILPLPALISPDIFASVANNFPKVSTLKGALSGLVCPAKK